MAVAEGREASAYLPDAASLAAAGASSWPWCPEGAASVLVQGLRPLGTDVGNPSDQSGRRNQGEDARQGKITGVLILIGARARALSQRDRLWAAAVAAKLHGVLESTANPVLVQKQ
jgi:hypothetical protein